MNLIPFGLFTYNKADHSYNSTFKKIGVNKDELSICLFVSREEKTIKLLGKESDQKTYYTPSYESQNEFPDLKGSMFIISKQ